MIRADTDGLLDRCQCGAVAGFVTGGTGMTCAMCADRCGQSTLMHTTKEDSVTEWNIMQRQAKKPSGLTPRLTVSSEAR